MISQEMMHYTSSIPAPYTLEKSRPIEIAIGKDTIFPVVFRILMIVAVVTGVWQVCSLYTGNQYHEMQKLRQEIVALERSNEAARLEVARLESLARIQLVAETELGMEVPESALYGKRDYVVDQSKIRD
jgi:cell division protein FtsL